MPAQVLKGPPSDPVAAQVLQDLGGILAVPIGPRSVHGVGRTLLLAATGDHQALEFHLSRLSMGLQPAIMRLRVRRHLITAINFY